MVVDIFGGLSIVLLLFALPALFLYLLYRNVKNWKNPFWALLLIAGLLLYVYMIASTLAAVQSSYYAYAEKCRVTTTFFTLFRDRLRETNDIGESASFMLKEETRKKTRLEIPLLAAPSKAMGTPFLIGSAVFLAFAVFSLFSGTFRRRRHSIWVFFAALAVGTGLFVPGVCYREYASSLERALARVLAVHEIGMRGDSEAFLRKNFTPGELIAATEEFLEDIRKPLPYTRHFYNFLANRLREKAKAVPPSAP